MTRALIVEDEQAIASMYLFKLEQRGYEVACALNGLEGLEIAENFKPQIILLDLRMPELSGDKMLEKLREQEWGANMRIIVLTNISRAEAPSNLRFLGVDRYIIKAHSTPSQVADVVEDIVGPLATVK